MNARILLVVPAAALAFASPAAAQHRYGGGTRVSVGVGIGVGGYGYGPGWGYSGLGGGGPYIGYPYGGYGAFGYGYPRTIGSHYSNGLSLYGPPVPTFGVTPGAFGGSYPSYANVPPLFGFGWAGRYSPSPRPVPTVSVYPTTDGRVLAGNSTIDVPAITAPGGGCPPNCIRVSVKLPAADAQVWFQGAATTATGAERMFESPPVAGGQAYQYTVVAKWGDRTETKILTGNPGETLTADFTGK